MNDRLLFPDRAAMRAWLTANHASSAGIWLILSKSRDLASVTAAEALAEALCFGWIDGQIRRLDDRRYVKRFTPRRRGSTWSARNRDLATALIAAGQMTAAGQAAIDVAKASGCWEAEVSEPVGSDQIQVLVQALAGREPARANLLQMPPSVQRTYAAHYLAAKREETRVKRLERIAERLDANLRPM